MLVTHQLRDGFSKFWLTPDVRMGVHYFQYLTSDFYSLPHTHPEYNLVICLSGGMEFIRNGEREVMRAGDVIMLNPGQMHQSQYGFENSPCETDSLIIDRAEQEEILTNMEFPAHPHTQQVVFQGKANDKEIVHL